MRRVTSLFATALLTAGLVACSDTGKAQRLEATGIFIFAGNVLTVTDGDTIKFNDERIRLLGIDTPEIGRPNCPNERELGLRAKRALMDILRGAEGITIDRRKTDPWGNTDRYDRTFAYVTVTTDATKINLSEQMLAEGYALPYKPGKAAKAERIRAWCN